MTSVPVCVVRVTDEPVSRVPVTDVPVCVVPVIVVPESVVPVTAVCRSEALFGAGFFRLPRRELDDLLEGRFVGVFCKLQHIHVFTLFSSVCIVLHLGSHYQSIVVKFYGNIFSRSRII